MSDFERWWKNEAMDERVAADYDAWLEANDGGYMECSDIARFQKEMAAIAWNAATAALRAEIKRKNEALRYALHGLECVYMPEAEYVIKTRQALSTRR